MGKKSTPAVEDRMSAVADNLMRWAAPKIENVLAWSEKGLGEGKVRAKIAANQATHQMEDTVDKVTPQIQSGLAAAGTALAGAASKVVSNVDQARHQVQRGGCHACLGVTRCGRTVIQRPKVTVSIH